MDNLKNYTFDSKIEIVKNFPCEYTEEQIKNEPMLFNCDFEHAFKFGGPLTHGFLVCIPNNWLTHDVVIDSRVHMLKKGWFPAIPGFHHDDVPRSTPTGQPNYDNPEYYSEHLMGLVNGEICPTLYAVGQHELPDVLHNDKDAIIYKNWHPIVEDQIDKGILKQKEAKSGNIIYFDWQSMHTAQRAKEDGWRWFIRVSTNTDRTKNITNEIRRQVQCYLEFPMEGW